MVGKQQELFAQKEPGLPDVFQCFPDLLFELQEKALISNFEKLRLRPLNFMRLSASASLSPFVAFYDFTGGGLKKTENVVAIFSAPDKATLGGGNSLSNLQQAVRPLGFGSASTGI